MIANGVVFSLSNGENAVQKGGEVKRLENTHPAVLRALDAGTGKELYNSGSAISLRYTSADWPWPMERSTWWIMTQISIVLD